MSGSSSQYWMRSLPLTSALLPTDTKLEIPRPSSAARPIISIPSAPDCDENPSRPRGGVNGANVAFIDTSGLVFTTPMQLGPTSRMPCRRASSTSSCSVPAFSESTSAKPAEMTTSPRTRFSAHWRTIAGTTSAGTQMTARSISSGTSRTVG